MLVKEAKRDAFSICLLCISKEEKQSMKKWLLWTWYFMYEQFTLNFHLRGKKIPVTHLNIFLKLYLVVTKLILSEMNIHKHIRNTPGDRKQPFPPQPFEIKRQSSPSAIPAFTEPPSSSSDSWTKRSTELKQAKRLQWNQHSSAGVSSCRMCFFFSTFNTVALAHLSILIYKKESACFKNFYNCFSEFILKEYTRYRTRGTFLLNGGYSSKTARPIYHQLIWLQNTFSQIINIIRRSVKKVIFIRALWLLCEIAPLEEKLTKIKKKKEKMLILDVGWNAFCKIFLRQ